MEAKNSLPYRIFRFYYDGFRQMTLGRTLWAIILIKLFIIFAILKVFFFPNFLKEHAEEGHQADYVATQILK
jgi:protein-S-isoprenylcysteine O-methyltransferase Ste14